MNKLPFSRNAASRPVSKNRRACTLPLTLSCSLVKVVYAYSEHVDLIVIKQLRRWEALISSLDSTQRE